MANRYWVGGTAAWDGTAGSKWALTSGGAGGQAVPTAADDVFFDAASGAVTCTLSATANCKSLTFTGFTGTFTGSSNITVSGNVTLVAGMTFTHTGTFTFDSTTTLITAGKSFSAVTLNSTSSNVTLGDAFTSTSIFGITVTQGTFTTNNYAVTITTLDLSSASTRAVNFGSSTITFTSASTVLCGANTNLTFNAGTSTIICTQLSSILMGGNTLSTQGVTFYNVQFTNTAAGSSTHSIQGINTFNNLSVSAQSVASVTQFTFNSRQTINGTLSTTGTAGNRRVWFRSNTYGIAQTLTINSAPSLTDADFRDIYVIGTSAPISGTRIGNLRGCSGITFSTPKTVYWNLAGAQNWSANAWATTSTGTPSTDNFPLAQDIATFTNAGSVTGTITFDTAITYIGSVDMSGRTSAMTLSVANVVFVYGNWTNGSGTTTSSNATLFFSGRNTQTITSAGRTFSCGVLIDSYGGTTELADALNIGNNNLTITNGTFDTKNYNATFNALSSSNSNVRAINLGASTLTMSGSFSTTTTTNLTFNAGTSQINLNAGAAINTGSGLTFYNVSYVTGGSGTTTQSITNPNTFNNLTVTAPSTALVQLLLGANQTINGTLTCAGATAVRRIFVRSDTLGTTRTLTVNTLSATDCDFRDITIAGTAAGSSPTRAGDCGGNTGITFPASKTVYWNLAGAQNWSATGWCPSSGGTPDINQFPLAQDTAVFDNTGSVTGTITVNAAWNIGTFDASLRTSAMTIDFGSNAPFVYGDWKFGTGVTHSSSAAILSFAKRGTQTITCNGVAFGCQVNVDNVTGTVQIADTLKTIFGRSFALASGTFDAGTNNVEISTLTTSYTTTRTLKMGSGTWTLSSTGTVWFVTASNLTFYKGTANIVLSDTSTTARTFVGGALSYNKLTIGGTTGTSTLTFSDSNQFTELASTKTVAHTIALGSTTQTFGAWTVTGTVGNVVTVTGTATLTIAGARVSGVDYLALGTTSMSTTSPAEFYAGANSTGGTGFILTAAPAAVTRYWRGGTGTWDATTTTNWSDTSGGSGGFSVPTSADAVIFDSASNATAYTVTCTATQLRCGAFTMAGPASGNVTWAGTAPIAMHDNVSLSASGITRSYTGAITLSGSTTGRTFTTNGVTIASNNSAINGIGCGWALGSALNDGGAGSTWYVRNGAFDTAGYAVTLGSIASINNGNTRSITLGSSTLTVQGFPEGFSNNINLTLDAGTSQINCTSYGTWNGGGLTFRNVSFTGTSAGTATINGANTFNNLSVAGITSAGVNNIVLAANQTINGTLTLSAGTNATMRSFVRSNTLGTPRTLTVNAFSGTDADFRDITVTGTAAPISGTRLGDCKGNSGITFGAGVTRYWNLAVGGLWSATGWAATSGGSPAINNFPLAQDTALFEATGLNSGATITINANYNIGTINMSARTSNTMTLSSSQNPIIYGNWINGTGTTMSGSSDITFAGRGSQTITSSGKAFSQPFTINTPGGSVTLQDAYTCNALAALIFTNGTFNANNFNVTLANQVNMNTGTQTIAVGSGTWTIAGSGNSWSILPAGLTVTGTGTIRMTSASAKTFIGGGLSYSGITLDQGGAGALTITGNNTFGNITNSYSATGATNITLGTTIQTVSSFTATGTVGKVLTIQGTSASSPATLILTSGTVTTPDYLTITGVRAYNLSNTWYAGNNSTNNGSLGWIFAAGAVVTAYMGNFFVFF